MTHEYVIALGGTVNGVGCDGPKPTAVGWAADRVLAVGSDEVVRTISRGDSVFIDIGGCAVTPAPGDPAAAEVLLRTAVASGRPVDALELLASAGLLDSADPLEPGVPADLAFWSADPEAIPPDVASSLRIVALVRAGAFTEGDEHCGPFPMAPVALPTRE